jgi:hypothetical protein
MAPAETTVSGLRRSRYSPLVNLTPSLIARANPAFVRLTINFTHGNRDATSYAVSSRESLSMRTTSSGSSSRCASSERRQSTSGSLQL